MGWDIGGFTGEFPTAELYLRSAAAAAFSPIMQYHSEFNHHRTPCADRTPWNVQERTGSELVVPTYRMFAHLRMALVPYLLHESAYAIHSGQPLVRPLCLAYPNDSRCWDVSDEYMLGRSMLVAPVLDTNVEMRTLYLPEGDWEDLWTGIPIAGGSMLEARAPVHRIPVYVLHGDRRLGMLDTQRLREVITRYSP
jgi:alpha-glucosidase (family GH31 glycosyl hydrolase)